MAKTQQLIGVTNNVVQYVFQLANFSDTNGTLTTTLTDVQNYWIGRKGSIIGVSGSLNAALTTGTLTLTPYIDGSVGTPVSKAFHTNQRAFVEHYDAFSVPGRRWNDATGHSLGLRYTSSDTVNPTTIDGVVIVEVLLEDVRY